MGTEIFKNACAKSVFFCPHFSVQSVFVVRSFIRVIRVIRGFLSLVPAEDRVRFSRSFVVRPLQGALRQSDQWRVQRLATRRAGIPAAPGGVLLVIEIAKEQS